MTSRSQEQDQKDATESAEAVDAHFGSGGTQGGLGQFFIGLALTALAVYLFFDSVRVVAGQAGWISGMIGGGRGGFWGTTSMGIIFVPFFLGVFALFVDAKKQWAWWLAGIGILIIAIEVLSQLRFFMNTKLSHLVMLIILLAAGCGLMFRSYRDFGRKLDISAGEQ